MTIADAERIAMTGLLFEWPSRRVRVDRAAGREQPLFAVPLVSVETGLIM